MTATAPTRSTFYQSQLAYLWAREHPGEPVPAVSDTLARELVQSSMPANFSVVGMAPLCHYCGVQLRLEPNGSSDDGMVVTDLVPIGDGKAIGHRNACRRCALTPEMCAARVKRKRGKRSGNFIEGQS